MATGVVKIGDRLITIVDFEKVLFDINPSISFNMGGLNGYKSKDNSLKPILVVEDSPLLERMILNALGQAGFINIVCTNNGHEAWDLLKGYKDRGGNISDFVSAIITDIEMPIMDGHTLIKLIKEDEEFENIPIFVFSSIVTEENRAVGERLGVIRSVDKPEVGTLIKILDDYIL